MIVELTAEQRAARAEFRAFAQAEVAPHADRFDREEAIPAELIGKLAAQRYLGSLVHPRHGGPGRGFLTYGLLTEELGKACSSVRSLLTVHDMVAHAIERWGSEAQRDRWLPLLGRGEVLGALALSEPGAGSDASGVATEARSEGDFFVLSGTKKWISFGQIAHLFLLIARAEGKPTAFLVERDSPGFSARPIHGLLGTRASMLAELSLEDCRVPRANLIGRIGFGVSHVAGAALELGRYSVAWGSVGIGQACLDASSSYATSRQQFGKPLSDHQLIRAMLSDMIVNVRAARLLCCRAGYLKERGDPGAFMEIMAAKYYASTVATRAALDAVQIHGANGISSDYPVGRYLRDSRVMEIIEGSTQIQQITLPQLELGEL
ncbi:MAG TPA: acyl-CoA dehydrogenase family protein [Thermoanaerobaculia bacterium]|nr:acyl-CoA dehydrogenase family protein [Thermoanaerobaculia bacterium]